MRILHTEASTGWGGQDIRVLREVQEMRRRGHTVVLACTPGCPLWKAAEAEGVPLEPVTFKKGLSGPAVRNILRLIRKHQAEIVNTHSSADGWSGAVAAAVARLGNGKRLPRHVRSRHLSNPLKPNKPNYFLYSRLTDFTLVTGEALRQQLIDVNGLDGGRILSVPTGVDLAKFAPALYQRADFRCEIGAAEDEFVWVMVAILRRMKGHTVLAEAAREVLARHPRTRFVLVGGTTGPTPLPDEIKAKIAEMGVGAHFHFTGMREDIPRILRGCDAATLPSVHGEGVPQSLAQALAMGLPVVATDVGAIGEIVRDGTGYSGRETGYLCPPKDPGALAGAMLRVMEEREETAMRTGRGQKLIQEEYSLTAMTDKVEAIYRQLLAGGTE